MSKFPLLVLVSALTVGSCATDQVDACRRSFEGSALQANDLIIVGVTRSSELPAPRDPGGQRISFVLDVGPIRTLRNPGGPLMPSMRIYDNLALTDILRHLPDRGSVTAMQLRPARQDIAQFAEYELVRTGCESVDWGR